jgi:hypothetical protein
MESHPVHADAKDLDLGEDPAIRQDSERRSFSSIAMIYISDITGETWAGCLASLRLGDGAEDLVIHRVLAPPQTLEMTPSA